MTRFSTPLRTTRRFVHTWLGRAALLALAGVALLGCGSSRPIKYYQLNFARNAPVATPVYNVSILVRPFDCTNLYRDDRIVYGWDSQQMGLYENDRWAEVPVSMVQDAIVRGLRSSGVFQSISTPRNDTGAEYVLLGHLYDFKEVDSPNVVARLSFEARLRERKSGAIVWRFSYNQDEPAGEKTVPSVVQALNKNLDRAVQELQAGLDAYFKAHPKQ